MILSKGWKIEIPATAYFSYHDEYDEYLTQKKKIETAYKDTHITVSYYQFSKEEGWVAISGLISFNGEYNEREEDKNSY